MELEEMQVIWNSDSQEKMYAINEKALYSYIKSKSNSVTHSLSFVEWLMILINLGVGIFLLADARGENAPAYEYVLPIMYLVYSVYSIYRKLARRQEENRQFEATIVGEVDRTLWRMNYLIKQSQGMIVWYLLPIGLVAAVTFYLESSNPLWPLIILLVVAPTAYLVSRWEVNKFYLPKKRELEALRAKLVEPVVY